VSLGDGESGRVMYTSDPVTAGPTLAGRNVTVAPTREAYRLRVTRRNGSVNETATVPTGNESVTVDGLRFDRNSSRVTVSYNGTRLRLLTQETYE
jgi:hypothetical protein